MQNDRTRKGPVPRHFCYLQAVIDAHRFEYPDFDPKNAASLSSVAAGTSDAYLLSEWIQGMVKGRESADRIEDEIGPFDTWQAHPAAAIRERLGGAASGLNAPKSTVTLSTGSALMRGD